MAILLALGAAGSFGTADFLIKLDGPGDAGSWYRCVLHTDLAYPYRPPSGQRGDDAALTEHTVKSHVNNILAKLQVADRTQAAIFAWREGLMGQ